MATKKELCCPPFHPEAWDGKELSWQTKPFVKDRVRCLLHVPLNFGAVMRRNARLIEAAGAEPDEPIVLSHEDSLWGADVYIAVSKDVPGARMTTLSGTFLAKVFEGPYRDIRSWIERMEKYVESKGQEIKTLYFYYTTCPKCAKEYGKNYVVLVAEI